MVRSDTWSAVGHAVAGTCHCGGRHARPRAWHPRVAPQAAPLNGVSSTRRSSLSLLSPRVNSRIPGARRMTIGGPGTVCSGRGPKWRCARASVGS